MQVVPDRIGDKNSSYNDFICALPDNQCRYAGVLWITAAGASEHFGQHDSLCQQWVDDWHGLC